jgi:hypothetical protein
MFLKLFKKVVANIKEVHDVGLFGIMSDEDLYFIFNGSPMFYVILPILGLLATMQTAIKGYELFKAQNKNLDRWFGFITSALCATLASISLYGSVAAAYFELNFALGPWFFLASVSVAFAHQMTMIGVNLYRVFESPLNSTQHKHFMQAALNNLFNLALLTTVMGAVAFVMISPAAPAVGAACALAAVGFTTVNILWRIVPHNWKRIIKNALGIGKPEDEEQSQMEQSTKLIDAENLDKGQDHHYQTIFIKQDHTAAINAKTFDQGFAYLKQVIEQKISVFNNNPLPHSNKNKQKKALLREVLESLDSGVSFSKRHLLERFPLAFQSFWAEKGDVEQIVTAAELLKEKYHQINIEMQTQAPQCTTYSQAFR